MDMLACTRRGLIQRQGIARNAMAGVFLTILAILGMGAVHASDEASMKSLTQSEQTRIEKLLTSEVQRVVNRQTRIAGQGKYATAKVTLDADSGFIVIDLSKSYLPAFYGAMLEDQFRELQVYATESLAGLVTVRGVRFLIEGKELSHFFPEAGAGTPAPMETVPGPETLSRGARRSASY